MSKTTTTTLDPALVLERLERYLADAKKRGTPISQADVARSLGCSDALISAFRNQDTRGARGNVPKMCRRLMAYLDEQALQAQAGNLVLPYVETRQTQIAQQCMELAQTNQWIVAVISESGHGKTIAIEQYLKQHLSAVYFRPWVTTCPSGVLQDICRALGKDQRGTVRALQYRLIDTLKDSKRLLIVDDAHDLGLKSLQVLRNLYDETGIGIALVGNAALELKLAGTTPELEQIARRVIYKRRLPSWTDRDAQQQIAHTLPQLDARTALALFHPKAKSSPAWVGKTIALAARLTEADSVQQITADHLREALEMVA